VEYLCVFVPVWLISGFLGGWIGREKNRTVEGFFVGFLFGPLGMIAMGFMPTYYSRKCPACRLGIPRRATRCCHCGSALANPADDDED
jgi:hypothetical protein